MLKERITRAYTDPKVEIHFSCEHIEGDKSGTLSDNAVTQARDSTYWCVRRRS
jgi:hypothetical protein